MKRKLSALLMILVLSITIFSCKKNEESTPAPETDLATPAAGTYVITSVADETGAVTAVPASANATVVITKVSNKVASFVITTATTEELKNVALEGTPSLINFTYSDSSGKITGTITNNSKLSLILTDTGKSTPSATITASR